MDDSRQSTIAATLEGHPLKDKYIHDCSVLHTKDIGRAKENIAKTKVNLVRTHR